MAMAAAAVAVLAVAAVVVPGVTNTRKNWNKVSWSDSEAWVPATMVDATFRV